MTTTHNVIDGLVKFQKKIQSILDEKGIEYKETKKYDHYSDIEFNIYGVTYRTMNGQVVVENPEDFQTML